MDEIIGDYNVSADNIEFLDGAVDMADALLLALEKIKS